MLAPLAPLNLIMDDEAQVLPESFLDHATMVRKLEFIFMNEMGCFKGYEQRGSII